MDDFVFKRARANEALYSNIGVTDKVITLKPENVDDNGTFKLSMVGSLSYMPPEVALGLPYNQTCDVYSFCILFWEMLAMDRPFAKIKSAKAMRDQVYGRGRRPPVKRDWPEACKVLLEGGWKANIQERFSIKRTRQLLQDAILENCTVE